MNQNNSNSKSFKYNGEWFKPLRKMTKAEREQSVSSTEGKLFRYTNEEFEKQWELNDFYETSKSDADFFLWKGKIVMPSWDTFYFVVGWL